MADNLYLLNGKNQFLLVSLNPSEEDIREMLNGIKNRIGIVREDKVYSLLNDKEIATVNINKNIINKENDIVGWADEEFAYSNRLLKIGCSYNYNHNTVENQIFVLSSQFIDVDDFKVQMLELYGIDILNDTIVQSYIPSL